MSTGMSEWVLYAFLWPQNNWGNISYLKVWRFRLHSQITFQIHTMLDPAENMAKPSSHIYWKTWYPGTQQEAAITTWEFQLKVNCGLHLLHTCGHRSGGWAKSYNDTNLAWNKLKYLTLGPTQWRQHHKSCSITVPSKNHLVPFVGWPYAWWAALHAKHVHGSLCSAEETAEAQERANCYSRGSSPILEWRKK